MQPERDRKCRLLVLNQYYWPGVEATAHLLSELCAALADEFEITVVTGQLRADSASPGRTSREGVTIVRVRSTAFDRRFLLLRSVNYATYLIESARTALSVARPDVVLCMTDPPIIGDIALIVARRFRAPLVVISQDVFPEIAVELGRLRNPALVGLLRMLVRYYLRRAERLVAIGETMRGRLIDKGADEQRIHVIPNWTNTSVLTPQPRDNAWARDNGTDGKFVVMHSGNVGHAQNLDALIRATTFLRDLDDLEVVIIGSGALHTDLVALQRQLEADKVRFLPYQPRERLAESLSSADVHVVGLARGLSGYVVPSRLYGILSVARPVIVAAEEASETAQVVTARGCGVVVPPGRPELLATAIRNAYQDRQSLVEMGLRGREYVISEADRSVAVLRYRKLVRDLAAEWA